MAKSSKSAKSGGGTSGGGLNPTGAGKPKKPPLTDAERHQRFVDMAREVQASEKPEDFDDAFEKVTSKPKPQQG